MHNKVNNVPKLRFPEFNKFLNKYLIGDLCDCIVPGRNKPKRFDGNIPWITTSDLKNNNLVYASKDNLNISLDEIKSCGAKIIPKHSVIMSCVGEFGLIAIAGKDIVINQQLHAFLPSNKLIENFALYSLMTKKFYMEKISTKTAVPYLNKNNCNSIPIYLPEKQEQQKIADFLSSIDNKLQALKQKQQLLQQYKKGMM